MDDGRALDRALVARMQAFGEAAVALRPAIVRSAAAAGSGCDHQYELPFDVLTSYGIADTDVTWALWSIDSSVTGLARNADFAPDGDIRVSAVPEPAPIASMLAGLGLLGVAARRRQAARQR